MNYWETHLTFLLRKQNIVKTWNFLYIWRMYSFDFWNFVMLSVKWKPRIECLQNMYIMEAYSTFDLKARLELSMVVFILHFMVQ